MLTCQGAGQLPRPQLEISHLNLQQNIRSQAPETLHQLTSIRQATPETSTITSEIALSQISAPSLSLKSWVNNLNHLLTTPSRLEETGSHLQTPRTEIYTNYSMELIIDTDQRSIITQTTSQNMTDQDLLATLTHRLNHTVDTQSTTRTSTFNKLRAEILSSTIEKWMSPSARRGHHSDNQISQFSHIQVPSLNWMNILMRRRHQLKHQHQIPKLNAKKLARIWKLCKRNSAWRMSQFRWSNLKNLRSPQRKSHQWTNQSNPLIRQKRHQPRKVLSARVKPHHLHHQERSHSCKIWLRACHQKPRRLLKLTDSSSDDWF